MCIISYQLHIENRNSRMRERNSEDSFTYYCKFNHPTHVLSALTLQLKQPRFCCISRPKMPALSHENIALANNNKTLPHMRSILKNEFYEIAGAAIERRREETTGTYIQTINRDFYSNSQEKIPFRSLQMSRLAYSLFVSSK